MAQLLHDAVWDSLDLPSTVYNSGDHISCIRLYNVLDHPDGGICVFPKGANLTLNQIRPLTTALLEHGCKICGSVPMHFADQGSNDPGSGIQVFNFVDNLVCAGNCIPA